MLASCERTRMSYPAGGAELPGKGNTVRSLPRTALKATATVAGLAVARPMGVRDGGADLAVRCWSMYSAGRPEGSTAVDLRASRSVWARIPDTSSWKCSYNSSGTLSVKNEARTLGSGWEIRTSNA